MTAIKNILYWLIATSIGGYSRGQIIDELFNKPANAHNLSLKLKMDYNTVRYHLELLLKNNLIETAGDKYGKTYFIKEVLIKNKEYFYEIWNEIKKNE